jgi:biopolymer transport protein ExbD
MRLSSGIEGRHARIEMVPLIDCMFLLLVFFTYGMLSMVVQRGVPIQLPQASSAVLNRKDYVSVTLTRNEAIYVDERPVTLDGLVAAVREARAGRDDAPVFLSGDRSASFGMSVKVLDTLRGAGIREVSIQCAEDQP